LKNGKAWLWIYHHPKTFFLLIILLVVALTLILGFALDNAFSPTHDELKQTLQVLETQVGK
jgi:hypothetical protein